jgi:hypothetical protein
MPHNLAEVDDRVKEINIENISRLHFRLIER